MRSSGSSCRSRGARRWRPSATTRSTSRSSSSAPATSRCRFSATTTGPSCTSSSATARCSRAAEGARIGTPESGVPAQPDIRIGAHALQCRITTEDPENNFIPDYGVIAAYRSPAGFGIRLDAGTAYSGAIITRSYDSLLVKVTAWSPTPEETIARMHRALWEFRIRGVVTNLRFLDQLITHPRFARGDYGTRFIDETPELFHWPAKRDRATRLLTYLGGIIVNGNAETAGRARPARLAPAQLPAGALPTPAPGTKQRLDELGPERFAAWMLAERRVLRTAPTMRDAHQSLLATRLRTIDMTAIARSE